MTVKWQKSNYPGVRFRSHPKRKHGVKFDRYFSIYYRLNGKRVEEGVGWSSQGWAEKKANELLSELQRNQKKGTRPQTLKEKRKIEQAVHEKEQARILLESQKSLTFSEYFKQHYYPIAAK